ncbi:PfkB family carbohydrate kinase [Rhodospirillales bacterium]|nr:PfkB family carbohydrate kinase [Rhodospirillales bacterium]
MLNSLSERYKSKIKTAEELRELLGSPPRDERVIMCHGVFDVVHPGHVRHLLFAKSKASILVASLTADRHISKGSYRPHVPQDLRALNLAAFEMIDYVLIDSNPTPIENLKQIQPDFFAKGYEYNKDGLPQKTLEEKQVVESYGGEVIFSPGDIVYSSSALIELAPPWISHEKLIMVMANEGIKFDDLRQTLDDMPGWKVHVVGDTIIDSYTYCAMIGGQTKTPTVSVLFESRKDYVGGAGVVAKHLNAAGAEVVFSTVLGDDSFKEFALEDLAASGVECDAIIDDTRPTVNKNAIVAGGYRLLKVDTLDNNSISDKVLNQLVSSIKDRETDAVVFSDFRHGIFNRRTIPALIEAIPSDVFKVGDSQVASRWGNVTEFIDFDLITPNEREARFALADQDSGIRPLASAIYDLARCGTLIMKLGERGTLTCRNSDHESVDSFFVMDSFAANVVDAVGAGDALLSYATLAMLVSQNRVISTILGSMAAACECEVDGNIPITLADVHAKINAIEKSIKFEQ